jgi:DNA-binding HxlR family transcriptional regulator
VGDLDVSGARCLELLNDGAMLVVIGLLRDRALSAVGVQDLAAGIGYRVALMRLRTLLQTGLVALDRPRRSSGREVRAAPHRLTAQGRALLTVVDAAAHCEAAWQAPHSAFGEPGARALSVAADREFQAIARALAHERLRLHDLRKMVPTMSRGTLDRRLRDRAEQGLVRSEKDGREAWLSLTADARRLATVTLYAARWEWMFGLESAEALRSDLAGPIHQLAPLASLEVRVSGVIALSEDWHSTLQGDVYLAIAGGRLHPYVVAPTGDLDLTARGTPEQWAHALVTGDTARLVSTGDQSLLSPVVRSLHREMCRPGWVDGRD